MNAKDHEWFDELSEELKKQLWDHRSEPLSPEILLALARAGRAVADLTLSPTATGSEFRLGHETWDYIWAQMSGACSAESGCSSSSASARLELLTAHGNKA